MRLYSCIARPRDAGAAQPGVMHLRAALLIVFAAAAGRASAQYGPDPPDTPPAFKCAWRKLAAKYAHVNRPDADAKVYDALQLGQYCGSAEYPRPDEAALPTVFPPREGGPSAPPPAGVFADADRGSDDTGTGTAAAPFATIQKAVDAAATKPADERRVILRNGTFHPAATVQIPHGAHGLSIEGMAGEEAWVSGGTKLDPIDWKPHNLSGGMNIWKADLSRFKLSEVPGLRVNGRRVTPARYPNADPETSFWPTGYMTSSGSRPCAGFNVSCGTREPCTAGCGATWKAPKIAPKPDPATVVNVTDPLHSREWDNQFTHYAGGIGGTCSIYSPPFSFWCSSAPFSAGCGGCFTWNIPSGIDFPSSMLQKYDKAKLVSNGHIVAWRAAHWANWHFEIGDYESSSGVDPESKEALSSITFGKGGFQGARGGIGSDWYISNGFEELDTKTEYY